MLHPSDIALLNSADDEPLFKSRFHATIINPNDQSAKPKATKAKRGRSAGSKNTVNLEADAEKFKAVLELIKSSCSTPRRNLRTGNVHIAIAGQELVLRGSDTQHLYLMLAEKVGKSATKPVVMDAINYLANQNSFDPVKDWFESLENVEPLSDQDWNNIGQTLWSNGSDIVNLITQRFAIMTVARVFEPGCAADWLPIACGSQGVGKSRTWALLCPIEEFCGEIAQSLDQLERERSLLHSNVINVLEEGDRIISGKGSNTEGFKNLISVRVDEFRKPYQVDPTKQARRFVLAATSNRSDFITDCESRRTLPIRIPDSHDVPLQWFKENHRRFWARALAEYRKGTQYLFTRKEIQRNQDYLNGFRTEDPVEQTLETYIEDKNEVIAWEAVEACLKIPKHLQDRKDTRRITGMLKTRGWTNRNTTRNAPGTNKRIQIRLWVRPDGDFAKVPLTDF